MEPQEQATSSKDTFPNRLLIDSASIQNAINKPGARPSDEFKGDHTHPFLEFQYFRNSKYPLDTDNNILFTEHCFYCNFDGAISGILTITNQYLFFKPDPSFYSNHRGEHNSLNTLFIEFKNMLYVEWATNFLPYAAENRPAGWELKLFYSLVEKKDEDFVNQVVSTNGLNSKSTGNIETNEDSQDDVTLSDTQRPRSNEHLQYQNSFIFVFDNFDQLDNVSNWLSVLLKNKMLNMPPDFNASSFAAETYLNLKHSTSIMDPYIARTPVYYEKRTTLSSVPYKPQLVLEKNSTPCLLEASLLEQLSRHLPLQLNMTNLSLAYSPAIHGTSFSTFYRNVTNQGPLIIIIKDMVNTLFGAFIEGLEQHSTHYYGTDATFVFTFKQMEDEFDSDPPKIKVYRSTFMNNFYVYSDWNTIAIGGGGHYALTIENTFYRGSSSTSCTFNNQILSSKTDFIIRDLQIWKFISPLS